MYTMGIDIGSTTSKCVIMEDGRHIKASTLLRAGIGTSGAEQAIFQALKQAGLTEADIISRTATGYGRNLFSGADYISSELTCHAIGGRFIFPGLRTLIDIGGQDAKVIALDENGKMKNFLMNDKCAAGTGRFLDVMASILQLDINDLGKYASGSDSPASISSTCTVFAESEVISQLASGTQIPDVVAGICESVAARVAAFAKRVGIVEQVCISGGVSRNTGVVRALEEQLQVPVACSEYGQLFGAIGAAIFSYQKESRRSE